MFFSEESLLVTPLNFEMYAHNDNKHNSYTGEEKEVVRKENVTLASFLKLL